MSARWRREARADLQLTATILAALLLVGPACWLGGRLTAPPQVVEVRTTITLAAPPVCEHAARAGAVEMDLRETRDAHDDAVLAAAADAFEAQVYGNVDEMVDRQDWANAEKLLRDEAERARANAEVLFRNHAAACLTWTVPQRYTERVPS